MPDTDDQFNADQAEIKWQAVLAARLHDLKIVIDDPLAETAHRYYREGHTVERFVADWRRVTGQE